MKILACKIEKERMKNDENNYHLKRKMKNNDTLIC
jgi:hypothetical protein